MGEESAGSSAEICEACHREFEAGVLYVAGDGVVLTLCLDCHGSIFADTEKHGESAG